MRRRKRAQFSTRGADSELPVSRCSLSDASDSQYILSENFSCSTPRVHSQAWGSRTFYEKDTLSARVETSDAVSCSGYILLLYLFVKARCAQWLYFWRSECWVPGAWLSRLWVWRARLCAFVWASTWGMD